jgi:hypothetical protein
MRGISGRWWAGTGLALAALCGTLAACGGDPGGTTGAWKYDEAASVERAGDSKGLAANIQKTFGGMTGTLEFHRDNSYHLTLTGGPEPRDEAGSFKSGNGEMVLNPKSRNGAPVDPTVNEYRIKAPDSKHLDLTIKGFPAVFTPAPIPSK